MSKMITVAKPDAKLKNRYITRKTLLYRSGVEGSEFCLNHAEGCSHLAKSIILIVTLKVKQPFRK